MKFFIVLAAIVATSFATPLNIDDAITGTLVTAGNAAKNADGKIIDPQLNHGKTIVDGIAKGGENTLNEFGNDLSAAVSSGSLDGIVSGTVGAVDNAVHNADNTIIKPTLHTAGEAVNDAGNGAGQTIEGAINDVDKLIIPALIA